MTLEFQKLTTLVERMGQDLANQERDLESKTDLALQIMAAYADQAYLPHILERVQDAIDKDAGYRGARPLDEPIMNVYPAAPLPDSATIVAVDGSQIPPDVHGAALYYLINIGAIAIRHGSGEPPDVFSEPALYYDSEYIQTQDHGLISLATVSARRTVAEMATLSERAWLLRGEARPLLALFDGALLLFPLSPEVPGREQLENVYFSAMTRLLEVKAGLAGYIDRPRSSFIVSLLHLLDIPADEVSRSMLATDGRLEGLQDIQVYRTLLGPSERSALFVQMSPQNKDFRKKAGETHEIAFFYINLAASGEPAKIARVEVPMWVANDREWVAELQALIYQQCQQLMTRYPYVLTRADELAVVKREEVRQLNTMIQVAMARHGLSPTESEKQAGKGIARGTKSRFDGRRKHGGSLPQG